jgi:hypothetical protein
MPNKGVVSHRCKANQRSYLNLQRFLASRPSRGQSINMRLQQVNANSTSNFTRGLPATHSATTLRTYDHRTGSPRNLRFKSTSPIVSQAGAWNVSKEDLRPSERVPHATGAFSKEDLWPFSMSPTQQARFKSTPAVRHKWPFSATTAAGVCLCNYSRKQLCLHVSISNIRQPTLSFEIALRDFC